MYLLGEYCSRDINSPSIRTACCGWIAAAWPLKNPAAAANSVRHRTWYVKTLNAGLQVVERLISYVAELRNGITPFNKALHVRVCVLSVLNPKPWKICATDFVYYHCISDNEAETMEKFIIIYHLLGVSIRKISIVIEIEFLILCKFKYQQFFLILITDD